jgi:hypothetical protein
VLVDISTLSRYSKQLFRVECGVRSFSFPDRSTFRHNEDLGEVRCKFFDDVIEGNEVVEYSALPKLVSKCLKEYERKGGEMEQSYQRYDYIPSPPSRPPPAPHVSPLLSRLSPHAPLLLIYPIFR